MEHGEKPASRTHLKKLAALYEVPESELMILCLSDKIVDLVKDEAVCADSLKLTMSRLVSH
jgi:HTH-type transcriptional regulator, competence development regulator